MIFKLDKNFNPIGTLENFKSLIWHEKYFECGNFEFHAPYSLGENAVYIYDNVQNQVGVIESLEKEDKMHLYKGRLLKSLLSKKVINRIITYYNKSVEYIVKDLVSQFALQNIEIEENQDRGLVVDTLQVVGENLMEFTDELLKGSELGAKIDYDFLNNKLIFKVFQGVDNSNKMPMSKEFENIFSFVYTNDKSNFKNFAYVVGEKSSGEKVTVTVDNRVANEEKTEIYVEASDVQDSYTDDLGEEITLNDTQFKQALYSKGVEALNEYKIEETIEIDPKDKFEIGELRTFRDGDLISVQRITERIIWQDLCRQGTAPQPDRTENAAEGRGHPASVRSCLRRKL